MKRTQLYIDDDLWAVVEIRAREAGTSVSELLRQALREKYLTSRSQREAVLRSIVGFWADRFDLPDTERFRK